MITVQLDLESWTDRVFCWSRDHPDCGPGMDYLTTLVVVGAFAAFALSFAIGGNDAANALGPAVGCRAVGLRRAVGLGVAFETLGIVVLGSFVSSTLKSDVVDTGGDAGELAAGMLCALLSSTACLVLFTAAAMPVSTTQTVVGAIVGFGVAAGRGVDSALVLKIVLTWFATPFLGLALAFLLRAGLRRAVLRRDRPAEASRRLVPHFFAVTAGVLSASVALIAADVFGLPPWLPFAAGLAVGAAGFVAARFVLLPRLPPAGDDSDAERPFGILVVLTAASVAFTQGANDVANAIGPYSAIVELRNHGRVLEDQSMAEWIVAIGAGGVAVGLSALGWRVIETVGSGITALDNSGAYAATLSTTAVVMLSTAMKIPVSTTTTLIGAVVGVGLAGNAGARGTESAGGGDGADADSVSLTEAAKPLSGARGAPSEANDATGAATGPGPLPPGAPPDGARARAARSIDLKLVGRIVGSWLATFLAAGLLSAVLFLVLRSAGSGR